MSPYFYLALGILFGVVRTAIEYDSWYKQKYNSIWFALVFVLGAFALHISENNIYCLIVFILSYWNAFELCTNIFHNVDVFYVGKTYYFDKLLRSIAPYSFSYLKCALQVLTIILIVILLNL